MKPKVLIYRSDWLHPTEGFVADHAAYLTRYAPITLGLRAPATALSSAPDHWACGVPHPTAAARYAFRAFGLGVMDLPPVALIHAHFATDALDLLPLARKLGVPLVTSLHGYGVRIARHPAWRGDDLHWRWKHRRLMREARLFLPVSQWLSTQAEAAGFPKDKLQPHYLGTPIPAEHERDRHGVLFVGRLIARKGLADLIEAMAILTGRGITEPLTVIGDGPERQHAQALASQLGVTAIFLGTLSPEATRQAVANARTLVLPSREESFGLVLIEAQAAGTPVVAYAEAGPLEAMAPHGHLIPPGNIPSLAAAIARLVTDEPHWQAASAAARSHAATHFDIVRRTAALEAIYDTVLGR